MLFKQLSLEDLGHNNDHNNNINNMITNDKEQTYLHIVLDDIALEKYTEIDLVNMARWRIIKLINLKIQLNLSARFQGKSNLM